MKMPTTLGWRFGLVILLLAIFSLLLGTQNAIDVNENTRCLANYAQRQAEVSAIRSAATAEKDAAVNEFLDKAARVIINPRGIGPKEGASLRAAAEKYRGEFRELKIKRAQNPLPSFPARCSEVNQ